jgi:hypothetical protein
MNTGIREEKTLYPFLSKLGAQRSVRFGIVRVHMEECRKIKFMYNMCYKYVYSLLKFIHFKKLAE